MANFSIKPLGTEFALTTANTCSNATSVRIYAGANSLITVTHTGTGVADPGIIGTFTMPGGSVEYVKKFSTDTVTANVAVNATPVAFY